MLCVVLVECLPETLDEVVLDADSLIVELEEPDVLDDDLLELELEYVELAVLLTLLADVHPYVKAHSSALLRKSFRFVDGTL
jgi:hypothetical protein